MNIPNSIRVGLISLLLGCVAACTNTPVNESLTPTQLSTTATAENPGTSTDGTKNLLSSDALAAEQAPSAAENVTEQQLITEPVQVAALDTKNALTFLTPQGAPQSAVASLSKSLKSSAESRGLALIPSNQTGAAYQVKGYFSALNDGSGTLLIYIWDVIDGSGKRVHRINGQERSAASKTNPWLAITNTELNRVADTTAARLKTWIDAKS
ncbi:MAG: hypothetical protein AAF217_02095 [Pseudomonadota bacterium]